jgi:diaminopimelate decarboxylase
VVSELELVLALEAGFPPDQILVNGPAKHRWLPRYPLAGLRVNFDSATELPALLPVARQRQWRVGLRLLTASEFDPGQPELPTQFGFEPDEAVRCVRRLRRAGMEPETLHFHLRTNLARAGLYRAALEEAAALCRSANWQPRVVDLGGGFPPAHTTDLRGRRFDEHFCLREMEDELARVPQLFPGAQEIWLENGRFLSARSGVLVVSVLDVKERRGLRQLICDGGRTMNALVSTWEEHGLFTLPARSGPETLTAVHGPTCMAFDRLTLRPLPKRLRRGDRLVWMEAGAYHLPWETRFSHGLAEIWWHDGLRISQVRRPETLAAPVRREA